MFTKLLKHEFRTTARSLNLLSLAALLVGVLGFIFVLIATLSENLDDHPLVVLIYIPVFLFIFISLFAYGIAAAFIPYKQFYQKKFTDEGYLTFTLPVTTHQVLLSSILNVIIWNIISCLVLIVSILMIFAPVFNEFYQIFKTIPDIFYGLNYDEIYPIGERIIDALITISAIPFSLLLPFVSITLGCLISKKWKIGISFCIGYGINMVVSTVTETLYILKLFPESAALHYISGILIIIIYLGLSVFGYFLMHRLIKNKLNI